MATPLRRSQIFYSVRGGLRVHRDLEVGWAFEPSIGIAAKHVDQLGISITNFREPLTRSIKKVVIPSIRKNFQVGGRPDAWDPLAEYTIVRRGYDAWPILVRSGRLKKRATSFKIWTVGETSAAIQSLPDDVWYGNLHQAGYGGFGGFMSAAKKELGTGARASEIVKEAFRMMDEKRGGTGKERKVQIPQRRFIMLQDEDEDGIQDIFVEWMEERAKRQGLM